MSLKSVPLSYGWIIEQDWTAKQGEKTVEGLIGFCTFEPLHVTRLVRGEGCAMRLYDSSGTLLYSGRMFGRPSHREFSALPRTIARVAYWSELTRAWEWSTEWVTA